VLRWHVTSRSMLSDALYTYDVLGRTHDQQLKTEQGVAETADSIVPFLGLRPLGTALVPSEQPRALLIDEIDKSDLDLPSDLRRRDRAHRLYWPDWRRRHQHRARQAHRRWNAYAETAP
jgi:MoxR-like ATPase